MVQARRKIVINAAPDAIWQVISDFGGAGRYLAEVVARTNEGAVVGALRTLTSADGSAVVERLEALDAAARELSYALLTDTPFRNCLTTMTVRGLGPDRAELEWSSSFEPDGLPEIEAVELLESALAANALALKHFVERWHCLPAEVSKLELRAGYLLS